MTVHFVGAGPGAADLLTLRAAALVGRGVDRLLERGAVVGATVADASHHGGARVERRPALGGGPDAGHDGGGLGVLEQVADRPGAERLPHGRRVGHGGEHDDPHPRVGLDDAARGLDPADAGHREVHEHDVRLVQGGRVDAPLAVGRLGDDRDAVGLVDEGPLG